MASCPNENTKEWKSLMEEHQGNRDLVMRDWYAYGYGDITEFNNEVENEEVKEASEALAEVDKEQSAQKTSMQDLMERTVLHIQGRIDVLQRQKDPKEASIKKLQQLTETMKAAQEVQSITLFVNDAYEQSIAFKKKMKELLIELQDPEADVKDLMRRMSIMNEFAYGYDILNEISTTDIIDYFNITDKEAAQIYDKDDDGKVKLSTEQKLKEAISLRDTIKLKIIDAAIPLLAKFLVGAKSTYSDKNIIQGIETQQARARMLVEELSKATTERRKKSIRKQLDTVNEKIRALKVRNVDEEGMIQILREAAVEEGPFEYWIGPLISSPDSAIALFAKAVKDQIELAKLKDIEALRTIDKAFEEYLPTAPSNRDNTKKFNEGIYEIIEVPVRENGQVKLDKDGNAVTRKVAKFVTRDDKKKRNEFYAKWDKANPKPFANKKYGELTSEERKELKIWQKKRKKEVTDVIYEPKSQAEIDEIDNQKVQDFQNGLMDKEEYEYWKDNLRYLQIRRLKFVNPAWSAMYDSKDNPINAKGKYHRALTTMYYEAQKKIPKNERPFSTLPAISKKDMERLIDQGVLDLVKTNIREAGKVQSYDTELAIQMASGGIKKFLPIYYVQDIDINDVSFDLASSVLLFSAMANKYEAMDEIHAEISLMQTVMSARKTPKFNKDFTKVRDAFAKKFGYEKFITQNGESFSKKHLDAFIDMIVYGEMQKQEDLGLANLSATKVTNTITSFSAITSIAADALKGFANMFQGNLQLSIEAAGGQYFGYKDFTKGTKDYIMHLPGALSDFGKVAPTSFLGMLGQLYDPLQGNFADKYGRIVTGSLANKLIRTDTLFFNQYFGEHEIQYSGMLSLMNRQKVRDKATKEEISLYDAHMKYGATQKALFDNVEFIEEDKDGNKEYRPFTEKDRRSFQDRLHSLSKKMHGIYNSFDKGVAQRHSLGRLALMYRKHMYPGFKRRYQKFAFDEELGDVVEGYYRTFFGTFLKDLRTYKFNVAKQWSTYDTQQKANIRRFLSEIATILTMVGLIAVLMRLGDDDEDLKDGYLYNFVLYEAIRMRSETFQYLNPKDAYRTIKSPSAALSTVSRVAKFTGQIVPWEITETYKKKQGIWEKGDNKAWAYFVKMIGLPGYNISPREAVKVYESLTSI